MDLELTGWGKGFAILGSGFSVWSLGVRVQGKWFKVWS